MEQRDLIIIGGGPAGYVAAIRARQLGARVVLIEKNALGGICLNHGCIPMRALVRGTEFLDMPKKAKDYGVDFGTVNVDFTKMMARKDTVTRTVVGGVELLMRANGIEVFKGSGKILSPSEVEVLQEDGTTSQISAPKVIIATGASLQKPDIPGAERMITTEEALKFTEVPRSILIVGGGSIGFAFATIFSKLGTSVTVIEGSSQILPEVDREVVSLLERELRKEKIPVLTDAHIKEIGDSEEGDSNILLSVDDEELNLTAQYVLAAEDWVANIDGLGLDTVGVNLSDTGIEVNSRMET